jgi:hypothetical protein
MRRHPRGLPVAGLLPHMSQLPSTVEVLKRALSGVCVTQGRDVLVALLSVRDTILSLREYVAGKRECRYVFGDISGNRKPFRKIRNIRKIEV